MDDGLDVGSWHEPSVPAIARVGPEVGVELPLRTGVLPCGLRGPSQECLPLRQPIPGGAPRRVLGTPRSSSQARLASQRGRRPTPVRISTRPNESFVSHIVSVICAKPARQISEKPATPAREHQGGGREPLTVTGRGCALFRCYRSRVNSHVPLSQPVLPPIGQEPFFYGLA